MSTQKATYYYIVAFNTEITEPHSMQADTNLEAFVYLGDETMYFEELMGRKDALPVNAAETLSHIKLRARMNPQRHIRIYGVTSSIPEDTLASFCREEPQAAEMAIKECGVLL